MDEALNTLKCQKGFILDGFPGTLTQAEKIDEMFNRRGTKIDNVFYFGVDDSTSTSGSWLLVFNKQIQPVIDLYAKKGNLVNIPTGKAPEEVTEEVKKVGSPI